MNSIQLIQVTPNELADLISENVKTSIQNLAKGLNELNQPHQKEIVSRKEVAEMFDVSLVTIHDWMNNDILKPYKIGGRTFFKRSELMQLLINSKAV
jgi:predicted DNA-binding transcriptional regulator AlpA